MKFDQREWVNDIVTGAITGAVVGALAVFLIPGPPLLLATAVGGIGGLVTGFLTLPIKWVLNLRPLPLNAPHAGVRRAADAAHQNTPDLLVSPSDSFAIPKREGVKHDG